MVINYNLSKVNDCLTNSDIYFVIFAHSNNSIFKICYYTYWFFFNNYDNNFSDQDLNKEWIQVINVKCLFCCYCLCSILLLSWYTPLKTGLSTSSELSLSFTIVKVLRTISLLKWIKFRRCVFRVLLLSMFIFPTLPITPVFSITILIR